MNSNQSYFNKVILLIILSILTFGLLKGILPQRLFPDQKPSSDNILIDSLLLTALDGKDLKNDSTKLKDSLSVVKQQTDTVKYVDDPTLDGKGYVNLSRFYEKLYQLETSNKGKARIAYFGDSMNDGDFIVQDVRVALQDRFGGQGVGFVSMTSLSAQSRYSVIHKYSSNWTTQSYLRIKKPFKSFGIDGQVTFAADNAQTYSVYYRASGIKHSGSLNNPTLFYGQSLDTLAYIKVKLNKDSTQITKKLDGANILNAVNLAGNTRSLDIYFHKTKGIPFYGLNFDDGQGVHVDNFSMRGNSGLPISILNTGLMNAFDRYLNYDLIVLEYGANILAVGSKSYDWYGQKMQSVIEHIKQCFPNADILIVSTADRAVKINGELKSDPGVKLLMNVQKKFARNTGSGFISLYALMGGEGSMIKWVDSDKLANKDYTHFNARGSKKVGELIYKEIEKGYIRYKAAHSLNNVNDAKDVPKN